MKRPPRRRPSRWQEVRREARCSLWQTRAYSSLALAPRMVWPRGQGPVPRLWLEWIRHTKQGPKGEEEGDRVRGAQHAC